MISDLIASNLERINNMTKNDKLKWRPLEEYSRYYADNKDLTEYITMLKLDESIRINNTESFFVKKEEAYLVLLTYDKTIEKNKTETITEILGIFHKNSEIHKVPAYFVSIDIQQFKQNIVDYWERKKGHYSIEVSDLLDFMDNFISEEFQKLDF